jgi:Nif-specific regulatory protein
MKQVYKNVEDTAPTDLPVLILGETGTGKGMIARLIHLKSRRRDKRFLTINCGTIPETLLESELFGHKKGSFTGAISDKRGLLEEAGGGTVFLDEITNTSLAFQAKLLEAIEEKTIRRVGETVTRKIDVRFLFATNRDLEIEVEEGRFRKDLFYRINVFEVEIPPLRDRRNDIPQLAQLFLDRFRREINKNIDGFTDDAITRLKNKFWPGNVRELQNVIERSVIQTKSRLITPEDIGDRAPAWTDGKTIKSIKKEAIVEEMKATQGDIQQAAQNLGINRRTIQRYIKKYKI